MILEVGHNSYNCEKTTIHDENTSDYLLHAYKTYGVRETSVRQNNQGVKISTTETMNCVLRPATAT